MTNSIVKFVASTVEVNVDTDILVVDIKSMGIQEAMNHFVDEALAVQGTFHIIDESLEVADAVANAFNQKFNEEVDLMKSANNQESIVSEEAKKVIDKAISQSKEETNEAKIAKSSAAKAFLNKVGGQVQNAKKAPVVKAEGKTTTTNEKDDKTMKSTNTTQTTATEKNTAGRRKLAQGATNGTAKEEKRSRREVLAENVEVEVAPKKEKKAASTRRKLERSESAAKGSSYVKHEGPWYLNKGLYDVLNRFDAVIDNMIAQEEGEAVEFIDQELGLTDIRFVNPDDISRFDNKPEVINVIELKSNGTVLQFPIKEANENSKSDLASPAIGWTETTKGVRPSFGHWRPNAMVVEVTCSCGHEFTANTGNMYCPKCRTRHEDANVTAEHDLEFGFKDGWVFEVNPNLFVPYEVLALVMALAQYDADLEMHGLVTE